MPNYNQSISASYLTAPEGEDQVFFLYTQLMNLPFSKIETVMQIERSLYQELNANPQDRLAVIGLLQVQIMLGNHEKAQAFAYRLWDIGAKLSLTEEFLYINSLINLGLLDMASQLLRPRFENLSQNIKKFFPVMLKFATMTGNINTLERLLQNPQAPYQDNEYKQIITRYKNYNYGEHFKNVMKIIHEELKDQLCACKYDIRDSVLADLEIYLYLGQSANELEEISQILREKIEAYCEAAGIEKVSNLNWQLRPVSKHQAMGLN